MKSCAILSDDRIYRYSLSRIWDDKVAQCMFIGLNPSTADETANDPTIIRCMNFSKTWGYGGIIMANLFAFRSTDPLAMKKSIDPIGKDNDEWLMKLAKDAGIIVAAWGNHGSFLSRHEQVKKMISPLHCLDVSKTGQPKHPLYLKNGLIPFIYK